MTALFQYITDKVRTHWLTSFICFAVFLAGTIVYPILYHFHVVPLNNKIADLERKTTSQNTWYIFNFKNVKIGATELKVVSDPTKSQTPEKISEAFIGAFKKKLSENRPPIEINSTPANLVKEGIKVTENQKGSIIISAPSTTYTGSSATIFYKAYSTGSTWEFIPTEVISIEVK
jgi:uncharacterized membrane protein YdfJ with MMPL/SSD domain